MPRWTPLFGSLLEDILSREADQGIPGECTCGEKAHYRCLECSVAHPQCQSCIVKTHRHLPFHWVDFWDDGFFRRMDLASLGLILHLGHHGMPCDEIATDRAPSTLIITHTNGIHESKVHWCACKGCPSRVSQLVRAGLFPATPENPESAFTIKLLEEFHLHTLTSKKSAYDFFKALYRLTNNAFPDDVPVSFHICWISEREDEDAYHGLRNVIASSTLRCESGVT